MRFVTPDEYIDDVRASGARLPHMRFHQVSWAPEIRLVLRSDGHYPPLHAGPFRGIDNDTEVFRRWPFIFWEPGRFISATFKSLLASFGHQLDVPMTGAELDARIDDLGALDDESRLSDPHAGDAARVQLRLAARRGAPQVAVHARPRHLRDPARGVRGAARSPSA